MDWRTITQDQDEHGIVTVRLNRPDARNALNPEMIRELTETARLLRARADVRAVILAGGDTFFSAGADLSDARHQGRRAELSLLELREQVLAGPDLCRAWEEIEAPTIVAVEGYCVGGACALAVSCDFRIMAQSAAMRLPEVPLGMNMSWRTLPRLSSLMGPARAKQFAIFGKFATAPECLAWGLAEDVTPDGGALAASRNWANAVAALPPIPVRMTKEAINAFAQANHHAASHMDRDQFLLTFGTADLREGIAAFKEKRGPRFEGR